MLEDSLKKFGDTSPRPYDRSTACFLTLRGVGGGYGPNLVVQGVDLNVAKGETVALLGPNGAGKSTLLGVLSGTLRVRVGAAKMDGLDLVQAPSHRIVAHGLVQVPEGRQILGDLTVLENLQLGVTALHRRKPTHDLTRIYALFPILEKRSLQRAGSLSGGDQQMLAIGRALMGAPRLLLLDEPSLGLSPLLTQVVLGALRELNAAGLTILLVEQNARQALRSTNRAYLVEQGRVVQHGKSEALARDPGIIAHYLGQAESATVAAQQPSPIA